MAFLCITRNQLLGFVSIKKYFMRKSIVLPVLFLFSMLFMATKCEENNATIEYYKTQKNGGYTVADKIVIDN